MSSCSGFVPGGLQILRKEKKAKQKKRRKKDGSININASPSNMPRQSSFLPPGVVLKNISDMWRGSGFTLFQLQNRLIILLLRMRGNFSLLFFIFCHSDVQLKPTPFFCCKSTNLESQPRPPGAPFATRFGSLRREMFTTWLTCERPARNGNKTDSLRL